MNLSLLHQAGSALCLPQASILNGTVLPTPSETVDNGTPASLKGHTGLSHQPRTQRTFHGASSFMSPFRDSKKSYFFLNMQWRTSLGSSMLHSTQTQNVPGVWMGLGMAPRRSSFPCPGEFWCIQPSQLPSSSASLKAFASDVSLHVAAARLATLVTYLPGLICRQESAPRLSQ